MAAVKNKTTKKLSNVIDDADKPKEPHSDFNVGSIVRSEYRKQAIQPDYDVAVLYESKAISCGFMSSYFHKVNSTMDKQIINQTINLQMKPVNDLADFLSASLNHMPVNKSDVTETRPFTSMDDSTQAKDLFAKCDQLPSQWNVVQMSQVYDAHYGHSTTKDVYTNENPIRFTLFRYNQCGEHSNRSISTTLEFSDDGSKSIIATAYDIYHVQYKAYLSAMAASPATYSQYITNLTQLQSKLVCDMKYWIGPFICLLIGKIKGERGEEFEKKIFDDVDKLVHELDNVTDDQHVLLNMIARRIDLLATEDLIKSAAYWIAETSQQYNSLLAFFKNLRIKTKDEFKKQAFEYYPCILIVDEVLDFMPWEMIVPLQEYTRVHSMYLLLDLYERYKQQIDDGYLKINIKNGLALINPDNDAKLADMHERMSKYYADCFPEWDRIELVSPQLEQLSNGLRNNDVFVYSGHGSSLHMFNGDEYRDIRHKCPMLLFGCDSIAMRAGGTIREATCTSYTYFKSGCPAILGNLTIVTDIWSDLMTISILTQWIADIQMEHPVIDVCKDSHSKERVQKILLRCKDKRNPNLLAVLCQLRNETDISIRMRSALVYRGLPTYNTAIEKY